MSKPILMTDAALSDIFVVLVSGTAISAADKMDGAEIGADDYIVKPVNPEEFLARIRTIVRLRDTTTALRASEQHYRRLVEILPNGGLKFSVSFFKPHDATLAENVDDVRVAQIRRVNQLPGGDGAVVFQPELPTLCQRLP